MDNQGSLDKVRVYGNLAATIIIPLLIAFIANSYTSAIKEQELSAKYVSLAIGILREEPTEDSKDIRKWAVDIVNMYSKVKISNTLQAKLLIEPIHISVDVNVKVDKDLDNFFGDIDNEETKSKTKKPK